MTNEQIREQRIKGESMIKEGQLILDNIRKICPHENTKQSPYSYRIGSVHEAIICEDCGQCMELLYGYM